MTRGFFYCVKFDRFTEYYGLLSLSKPKVYSLKIEVLIHSWTLRVNGGEKSKKNELL